MRRVQTWLTSEECELLDKAQAKTGYSVYTILKIALVEWCNKILKSDSIPSKIKEIGGIKIIE